MERTVRSLWGRVCAEGMVFVVFSMVRSAVRAAPFIALETELSCGFVIVGVVVLTFLSKGLCVFREGGQVSVIDYRGVTAKALYENFEDSIEEHAKNCELMTIRALNVILEISLLNVHYYGIKYLIDYLKSLLRCYAVLW